MKKLLLSLATLLLSLGTMAQDGPQVKTAEGILEGLNLSGIKVFKGVPFAAPPVGNLRWKAPQPVEKWEGVRKATEFGPNPMQEALFGDMNFGTKVNSEDCCTSTSGRQPRPCKKNCLCSSTSMEVD